jgi:hypothetical protein
VGSGVDDEADSSCVEGRCLGIQGEGWRCDLRASV